MSMKSVWFVLASAALLGAGCHTKTEKAADEQAAHAIHEVSVAEAAQYVKAKSAVLVDANGRETRQEYGVIPGAVLLSDHKQYRLDELPGDKAKKLVFYCGGVMCRASDAAAERAQAAGYRDVNILRAGIKGWKSDGQPTDTPRT